MTSRQHITLLSPAVGTDNIGDVFIEQAIKRFFPDTVEYYRVSTRSMLTEEQIQHINDTDCVLLCGTNLYQHDWHAELTLDALEKIQVPFIPFGVGGSAANLDDKKLGPRTREMIVAIHRNCSLGSVRDPYSAEVVASLDINNFLLTGCPVLFWAQQPLLPEVKHKRRQRIVITARNWLMHRWPENVDHPVQIEFLRKVIESLPLDKVIFAIHEPFDRSLIDKLELPAEIIFDNKSIEEYIRLYTDPDHVVLAMRLHAGMLSLANGGAPLFISHDTRSYSFCQMMGLNDIALFAADAIDQTITRLHRLLAGDVSEYTITQERFQKLRQSMFEFLSSNNLPARA